MVQDTGGDRRAVAARAMDGNPPVAGDFGGAFLQMIERQVNAEARASFQARKSQALGLYTSGSCKPLYTAISSPFRICGTTCSGITRLMLWQPRARSARPRRRPKRRRLAPG